MGKPWVGALVAATFLVGMWVGLLVAAQIGRGPEFSTLAWLVMGLVTGALLIGLTAWLWKVEAWIDAHTPEEVDSYE